MGFSISGYVLEAPRVGQANSPFTQTPNDFISNQAAYDAAYPTAETNSRTEYLIFVFDEGAGTPSEAAGFLANAKFSWTKNEGASNIGPTVNRFDYAARLGRFKPLPGSAITVVGTLNNPDSNTTRLKVKPPVQAAPIPAAPYRLSVGATGSGTTFVVAPVPTSGSFTVPPLGTVELALDSGELNWNPTDLATYNGQTVWFQQQQFFGFDESTGRIGFAPVSLTDPLLFLNPLPGSGQFPLLRFGYGDYLQTTQVANDAGLVPAPASGFVKWSLTTGRLAFNAADASANAAIPLYYDGVVFARDLLLPRQSLGLVSAPTPILGLPPIGGDLIFALPSANPYYQFPKFSYVTAFSGAGQTGVVKIIADTGAVQFSTADVATYGGEAVEVIFGDLPIEHGISLRLFRTPVNLDASRTEFGPGTFPTVPSSTWADPKDVSLIYQTEGATWADPIIGSPQVFLPAVPIDTPKYPFKVKVLQGQGSYTSGDFPRLDIFAQGSNATIGFPPAIGTSAVLTDLAANFVAAGITSGCALTISGVTYSILSLTATTLTFDTAIPVVPSGVVYTVSPPAGKGYYIDFDTQTFYFAERKNDLVLQTGQASGAMVLPDPLVLSGNATFFLNEGAGYNPLVLGDSALFDGLSGVVSFITNNGTILAQGICTSFIGTIFTDSTPGRNFVTEGVLPGHLLEVDTTGAKGVYTVVGVASNVLTTDIGALATGAGAAYSVKEEREILADRYFSEVVLLDPSTKVERIRLLGTASNAPRLNIPTAYVSKSRFRFGPASANQFSTTVLVANNGAFTSPALLPAGTVEISQASGDLNFASADLGTVIYWVKALTPKADYQLSAGLGLIQFTERMLQLEEVLVNYTTAPPSTDPPTEPGPPVQEYGTFLIRKEITQAHPTPASTLSFNVAGLPVASNPPPAVFRGGRPQQLGVQCTVDIFNSTITFLADNQITNALPHGATVGPSERVYIDYYVTQAVGGEKTITVLVPPLLTATVNISDTDQTGNPPNNQFVVYGDQTANFPSNHLLRIEKDEVYLIGNSVYPAPPSPNYPANSTQVTLAGNQQFQNTYNDPKVYVSSGPTLISSYFVTELQPYEVVARGMNKFLIPEDRTLFYKVGAVVLFTDSLPLLNPNHVTDFYQVLGSKFDPNTNRTEVTLSTNGYRQYNPGTQILMYSVRPLFEPPVLEVQTSSVPVLTQPVTVYRRIIGQVGQILSAPVDYTLDASGKMIFTQELLPNEEFSIFYTGSRIVPANSSLKASYTCQIAPNSSNGLTGQILQADYFLSSPDTFFYRVETMTNFRGEYAAEIASKASSGSSGPQTSNSSQPKLFEQGRASLYFDETHLSNQDIVARSSLLFYNEAINDLEALMRLLNGRVVGNNDGPFLFDGTTGVLNPSGSATFSSTTALDDLNASFTSVLIGRFVEMLSGTNKPEKRLITAVPLATRLTLSPAMPTTGAGKYRVLAANQIDDLIQVSAAPYTITTPLYTITSIGTYKKYYIPGALSRFYPTSRNFFGVPAITADTETGDEVLDTGATNVSLVSGLYTRLAWATLTESSDTSGPTLKVDDADGSENYARPAFVVGMECLVQRRDGSFINPVGSPVTVTGVSASTLTVSGLAGVADIGTTIYQSPKDTFTPPVSYVLSRDYSYNGENGQVIFIESIPALPNTPLVANIALSGKATFANSLTAPFKFPALYGGVEDDDGDLSFPIQSPDPVNEQTGSLADEDAIIHNPTGTLRTLTTPQFESSTGTCTATVITNGGGPFPVPLPQARDLVRIKTGLNAGAAFFRRIIAVGVNTVTVSGATPFTADGTPFTYEITVSATAITGLAVNVTFPTTTTLQDTAATFITAGVKPGYTLVLATGERLQITLVNSATKVTFTPAVVSGPVAYRIDNSLATYGGTPGDQLTALETALDGELAIYPGEQTAILDFLNQVFTDITVSATGSTVSTAVLTDLSANFVVDGVATSHFVFIQSGGDAGIYQISSVDSATQLTMTSNFPATLAGVSYRVVSAFGVSFKSLDALFDIYLSLASLLSGATAFKTLITTPVPVLGVTCFARATLTSDLDTRDGIVDLRLAAVPGDVTTVNNILVSSDALYDTRYVWIDARINLESGLVVQQATAVTNRLKSQANIYNQLVKLLAVES